MTSIHGAAFLLLAAVGWQSGAGSETTLGGKLVVRDGRAILDLGDRELRLSSDRSSVQRTLEDPRNAGRVLRVTGLPLDTGDFEVHDFFVVRADKVYRLVYYCDT